MAASYGKRLMDAFFAEGRVFRSRDEYAEASVMDAMENAVNNVMHGLGAEETRNHAVRHVEYVLGDTRIELSDEERAAYGYALDVIESVPLR